MISPLAYVHPDAKLGENVTVEPFAYIAGDVEIGDDCWIGPGAVIHDGARIGKRNKIHTAASISCLPQDLKFVGEKTTAVIGDDNDIRECVTISRGTASRGTTVVGSGNLLMAYVHVAHDDVVGNHCVIANRVSLAGEVEVGDWVVAGQMIGQGGSTGRSTGPHLHFEVRYKGQSFDPERIVDFTTGELRSDELLLKRRHFSIYAKYEQDFDDETEAQRQADAEKKASSVQYHTVRSGENLSVIARKYGTTVNKLCNLNGIKSTTILSIGRKLRVK